jgi:hypothetical protein
MKTRAQLESELASHMVDGMDMDTMVEIVFEVLTESYAKLTDVELNETVQEYASYLLDEEV